MASDRGQERGSDIITAAGDAASEASRLSGGGLLAVLVSALALIFSGISLYQTVLKQAQLRLFTPDAVYYTRDPDGSFEVFVIPVTLTNSGARDGIVSKLVLKVLNRDTGKQRVFRASYIAGERYFSTKADISKQIRRPKTPFAPLSVSARGSFTGTLLFYPRKYEKAKVLDGKGRFELNLLAISRPTEPSSLIDSLWGPGIKPLIQDFELPAVSRYFEGRMLSGHTVRLFAGE